MLINEPVPHKRFFWLRDCTACADYLSAVDVVGLMQSIEWRQRDSNISHACHTLTYTCLVMFRAGWCLFYA